MAFTENVLAYTKQIEKVLTTLGGVGIGMVEKAKSLPSLPEPLLMDLRKIAWVRNRLVHDHDYRFAGNEEMFLGLCKRAVATLSSLLPRTESSPQSGAKVQKVSESAAPASTKPPPPVQDSIKREFNCREHSSEGSSQKESASAGSSGADASQPPNANGSPTGSSSNRDATILALVLSAAAAFASWKILPHFCVRTVETGFWPFNSSHQEVVWELVLPMVIAIGVATYFVVRYWNKMAR